MFEDIHNRDSELMDRLSDPIRARLAFYEQAAERTGLVDALRAVLDDIDGHQVLRAHLRRVIAESLGVTDE